MSNALEIPKVQRSRVWPWMRELRGLSVEEAARAEQYRDAGVAYDGIKRCWVVAEELVSFVIDGVANE